ncbi:acyltransferase family protein [Sinorhizobium mexicanum]|uniref:Acyltransferase n=1 Tax=Sinorhizobium mexicanum TaxID=375549 RepID=A0A859QFK2_9HYPH|nr:acyltransferase family protein [Sinorhizobium mexicanum]MBP1883210.1 peptidoglycan/LPS O-acetylase OafA/YrhL [Sinorhizobium mexicanum]QLL62424.1 acyltransferase [Sinorhizobium mexicanum]
MKYRRDIDGVRAIAVMSVVFCHAGVPGFSGGLVGVDVFFVVSGFLIAGILHRELAAGRFSLISFYERRARRILPALFFAIAACLVAAALLLLPDMFVGLARSALAAMFFSSNIWFWYANADYYAPDADLEPLLHTWSLGVEEQFYIVFPLVLWWLFRLPRRSMILAFAGLCVASFLLSVWASGAYPRANFYLAPTRAWELGLGVLLAVGAFPACRSARLGHAASLLGLGAILAAVASFDNTTLLPGFSAMLPAFGALALLWAGEQRVTVVGRMLSASIPVAIGLISYSLYLWHWPIIVYFKLVGGTMEITPQQMLIAIALSLAGAYASWRFIETPFRRRAPNGFTPHFILASSSAAVLAVAVVAATVNVWDGFPGRLSRDAQLAYSGTFDIDGQRDRCGGKTPPEGLCRIGADTGAARGKDSILLWGDSHAGAIMSGLDVLLERSHKQGAVAFKGGCPPLLGVERLDKGPDHDCSDFNAAVMSMLRKGRDSPVVVLSARWSHIVNSDPDSERSGPQAQLVRKGGGESGPEEEYALFATALLKTVRAIRSTGRKVIIVDDIPDIGWSVPRVLGLNHFIDAALPPVPTRAVVEARNARVNRVLEIADKDAGVQRVSAVPLLCRPVCMVAKDGIPLYSDEHHLSVFGATTVVPMMMKDAIATVQDPIRSVR